MPVRVKLIDRTLFVVLHNGGQEITRPLASSACCWRDAGEVGDQQRHRFDMK
jgi:hypothetical protein